MSILAVLSVLPCIAASNPPISYEATAPTVPPLNSCCFKSFLRRSCPMAIWGDHLGALTMPTAVDFENEELIYLVVNSRGALAYVKVAFDDFKAYYYLAFRNPPTYTFFKTDLLSDLLKLFEGALAICSPRYLVSDDHQFYSASMHCLRENITDFSCYEELEKHAIPAVFFLSLLRVKYPCFTFTPTQNTRSSRQVGYAVSVTPGTAKRIFAPCFAAADAFCFYAANIEQVDSSVVSYFEDYPTSPDGYMSLLNRPNSCERKSKVFPRALQRR